MGFIYGADATRATAQRPRDRGHCIPRTNAAGNPYPYGSAATLEAVTTQGLQREQQTVRVVVQTLCILDGGVQEFAGVHRKAHRVVGVALRGSTELTQAFAFVGTVADVCGSQCIILFGGPLGSSSTAGVHRCFDLLLQRLQDFASLLKLQAVLTVQVSKTESLNIVPHLFVESDGGGVGSGEVQSSHLVSFV